MAFNAYIKKRERPKISHLSFHLWKLEKEVQIKSQVNRRKDIMLRLTYLDLAVLDVSNSHHCVSLQNLKYPGGSVNSLRWLPQDTVC